MINEVFIYIVKCIYIIIPGAFAVMTPIFVKDYFQGLAVAVDFGKTFRGKPIFGKNKTFRGFIFGTIASILVAYIQSLLFGFSFFQNISFVNYAEISVFAFGFLMGFGALFGDVIESFFKRQLDIAPGKPFMPWDQIDAVIGGSVFILPVFRMTWIMFFSILVVSFLIHIGNRTIAYKLGLSKDRW